jgi:hypothetical protein
MINALGHRAADNVRLVRSEAVTLTADDTYALLKLPKKAFVTAVWLEVITPFDDPAVGDEGTLTLGFSGNGESADVDYFMATNAALPLVAGNKVSTIGKWFGSAAGLITVTAAAEDSTTAPVVRVWATYSIIH